MAGPTHLSQVAIPGPDPVAPVFSPDGSKLAYVDAETGAVFIKDLASGTISTVDVVTDGVSGEKFARYGVLGRLVFSPDGNKLAFYSPSALVPDDTNGIVDVYAKDLMTGDVTHVSSQMDGTQAKYGFDTPLTFEYALAFTPDSTTVSARMVHNFSSRPLRVKSTSRKFFESLGNKVVSSRV